MEDSSFIVESIAGVILFAVGVRVLEKVLPDELEKCGVNGARNVCTVVSAALASVSVAGETSESAGTDEVFRRLGGS